MKNNKVKVIAEIGPNHNGDYKKALRMITFLKKLNIYGVKFQINNVEKSYSKDSFKANYQKNQIKETPSEMALKYQLSEKHHKLIKDFCDKIKINYLCSPFDLDSTKFLCETLKLKIIKIASGEILSLDILNYLSKKNVEIILSTGMSTLDEIQKAISILNQFKRKKITILHCTSSYPTKKNEANLNFIDTLKKKFDYDIGFSDHTIGNDASIMAIAKGSKIIEKHFTFNKNDIGPDHKFSMNRNEFKFFVSSISNSEYLLGSKNKIFSKTELQIKKSVRKSIVSSQDIPKGKIIEINDICFKRPGTGISPLKYKLVLGKKANKLIKANKIIKKEYYNWKRSFFLQVPDLNTA